MNIVRYAVKDSFEYASAALRASNGRLGLMLARIIHRLPDGYNHQTGTAHVFDTTTLEQVRSIGHVCSHSITNYLTADAQGNFVGTDIGDTYPRGLSVHVFNENERRSREVFYFKAAHGTTPSDLGATTSLVYDEISTPERTFYR